MSLLQQNINECNDATNYAVRKLYTYVHMEEALRIHATAIRQTISLTTSISATNMRYLLII
jgi:diacylglycerol kinase